VFTRSSPWGERLPGPARGAGGLVLGLPDPAAVPHLHQPLAAPVLPPPPRHATSTPAAADNSQTTKLHPNA
jgi:hypothetical protein